MVSGFLKEGAFFLSWLATPLSFLSFFLYPKKPYGYPPFLSLFLFISQETLISFLQK
jgi:hypothetical protein